MSNWVDRVVDVLRKEYNPEAAGEVIEVDVAKVTVMFAMEGGVHERTVTCGEFEINDLGLVARIAGKVVLLVERSRIVYVEAEWIKVNKN